MVQGCARGRGAPKSAGLALVAAALLLAAAGPLAATELPPAPAPAPVPAAALTAAPAGLEWAVLPVLSGNSDIGFMFGVFGGLVQLDPADPPYRWKGRAVAAASVKDGPGGVTFPQHMYEVHAELIRPDNLPLRLTVRAYFERTVNAGYFGIGNAARADRSGPAGGNAQRFQYVHTEPFLHVVAEVPLYPALELLSGFTFRYVMPTTYGDSLLREHARGGPEAPRLYGLGDHATLQLALGLQYDSRDDRRHPSRGMHHTLSLRGAAGTLTGNDLDYGGVTLHACGYVPLWGPRLVLAGRVFADWLFGRVPFHDLASADAFQPTGMPGGPAGIRGVPDGRYRGKVKFVASFETRSTLVRFHWFGREWRIGAAAFVDVGRIWADVPANPRLDGRGAGLTYGVGAGPRFGIGEALYFRLDFSYAPEAVDANPDLPIGIYFALNEMF